MFAGLQWHKTCWCGNSYGSHGKVDDSECNDECTGDASQMCGGGGRNSVYSVGM